MKSRIAVISLRFNPAFVQHAVAFAKLAREAMHEPAFILDNKYESFPELKAVAPIFGVESARTLDSLTHAIFLNASPENQKLAVELKARNVKLYYILHEPWQISWNFITSEGLQQSIKTLLAHYLTTPVLRLSENVLLASHFGLEAYQKHDVKYNQHYAYFPLIYDDKPIKDVQAVVAKKQYFGFLGSLCRAHGFDHYLSFMRYAFEQGLDVRFLIASRYPLSESIRKQPIIARNLNRIEIRCGRALSNEEMDQCYAESISIWMLYRRCTQSGVLPKAMMHGAPVIAAPIGAIPEQITEGVNGRFSRALDHARTWDAFRDISTAREVYFENCRQTFLTQFYYRSMLPLFEKLL
jgi:glycosyltransferase involved in cell wall biosynthesis